MSSHRHRSCTAFVDSVMEEILHSVKKNLNSADSLYSLFLGTNVFNMWVSAALANCVCASCGGMHCQGICKRLDAAGRSQI